jgi:hypothetical protein
MLNRANKSLLFLLNAACLANPRHIRLEASTLTITPLRWFINASWWNTIKILMAVLALIIWYLRFTSNGIQSVPITTTVCVFDMSTARCTWYNFMWYSLSVTCSRFLLFYDYSVFSINNTDCHNITIIWLNRGFKYQLSHITLLKFSLIWLQ